MYFIPFIRDYIESINTIYESLLNVINFQTIIKEIVIYLFQSIKFIIIYLLTFQWFRDLIYLPTIIPNISNSILKEQFFLENPLTSVFNFLQIPSYSNNKFFIGFLNSFFLSLPLSCAQLLYVRRLLVQGSVAGIVAGLGNIFGSIFFIGSVILGCRFLIYPWFSNEPIYLLLGFFLLLTTIYNIVHEQIIKILDWKNKSKLIKIFLLHFILIWTEQSCIFQYLGNITLSSEASVLEPFNSQTSFQYIKDHGVYLIGLFFGYLLFTFTFAIIFKNLSEFIQIQLGFLRSTWIIRLNFVLLTCIVGFSFSSIPYYTLDYLVTKPLGFISNDKAFKNTIFSQNDLQDPFRILGADKRSLDTDVTSFDRGFYLKAPIVQTFEDLNYSGEYGSTIRQGNLSLYDQYKTKAKKIRDLIIKTDKDKINYQEKTIENSEINKNFSQIKFKDKEKNFTIPEYPTYYPIKKISSFSYIQRRFEDTYKESSNGVFKQVLDGTLNNIFSEEKFLVAFPEIEKKLKDKYYANPIYKFLVTIDIDNFLRRQPSNFLLSWNEEKELYKKRLMLARYHDTLRFYNKLSYTKEFQYYFNGSKSYADRIYNQQFKGTLQIVRRLFSVSFNDSFDNTNQNYQEKVLKYDQSLFKNIKTYELNYHEELNQNFSLNSTFLEEIKQTPLYAGWDNSLKKITISNRLLPKLVSTLINPKIESENYIQFSAWPIKKEQFVDQKDLLINTNSKFLFQTKSTIEKLNYNQLLPLFDKYENQGSGICYYNVLPNNITKLRYGFFDIIPPNRGGFVWPGNNSLNFSIFNVFPKSFNN